MKVRRELLLLAPSTHSCGAPVAHPALGSTAGDILTPEEARYDSHCLGWTTPTAVGVVRGDLEARAEQGW